MITRRLALQIAVPLVALPIIGLIPKEAEALPAPQANMTGPELVTHFYAIDHHDPIQLGTVPDTQKAVKEALGFAAFIIESSERNHIKMPPHFYQMVERLRQVERTGLPVTYTTEYRTVYGHKGVHFEMKEPIAKSLAFRQVSERWEVDLPEGVEVVIQESSPFGPSSHLREFTTVRHSRQGESSLVRVTITDPSDETETACRIDIVL